MSEPTRTHGGLDARELAALGLDPASVLDLSVNVNPWGPHPAVVAAIQRACVDQYPEPWASGARAALARFLCVDEDRVVVGHGSTELIWTAVSSLRGQRRPLLIAGPTFGEPLLAARAYGVPCVHFLNQAHDDFTLDVSRLSRALEHHDARAVYLCQPNNPDGGSVPAARLRELCQAHPARLFVLDQAFLSLSKRHADLAVQFPDNVLVVRSLTKEHALPGLRVGYALGAPALIERLNALRPSWMVSSLAEAAVVQACAQQAYVAEARAFLLASRAALADACRALGLRVIPSTTSYFMMRVGDAERFRRRLLARHGIAVRSCASFGVPDYVRVAACGSEDRARFVTALRKELDR